MYIGQKGSPKYVMSTTTTVYVGNLDVSATVEDLHREFDRYGRIRDVWVARKPPGFAFIEFDDERDAKDAVKDMDGRWILDKRIRVEISRRGRGEARRGPEDGSYSRGPPRRTDYRVNITGLATTVSWRELKDMLRDIAEPAFVDVFPNGEGVAEFLSQADVDKVILKLDDTKFHGNYIRIKEANAGGTGRDRDAERDSGRDRDRDRGRDRRDRDRSKSKSRSRSRDAGRSSRRRAGSSDDDR